MHLAAEIQGFAGDDPKMARLVSYWGVTVLLYLLCLGILWIEVYSDVAPQQPAIWLTALAFAGHGLFYLLIRKSKQLGLAPAQLSVYQGRFAIIVTVLGYTIVGPMRGATLVVLLVILVFCAFTLEAQKTRSLSVFAVVLLGAAMIGMRIANPERFETKLEIMHFVLIGTMVVVVGFLTGRMSDLRSALKLQKQELADALARIQELAVRDDLTLLPNRRYMNDLLAAEERRRAAAGGPTCLALLDIDWFKRINDTYGHAAGDHVLRRFAEESRTVLRPHDVLARWGGEEFLLLLPGTARADAELVLERFRERVQQLPCMHEEQTFSVTMSAGLIELGTTEACSSGISRADALLYRAKSEGRNRVVVSGPPAAGTHQAGLATPAFAK
ncbi:MAG TPA: GGDEF domain-containing protein [Noviherbaspirillum sp.]|uniref:GGDEF domain-containing protein n=1 Tax=Noviherbaspirillum sp. TaxID=1926288 RepID=UPI002D3A7326|nr:GGDEF domain-containing protein [Noviherbaspirillum sp.]HYD93962.1 GGDEF domain-containing protein [Noviherbaspirillum sp.]